MVFIDAINLKNIDDPNLNMIFSSTIYHVF